MPAYSFQERFVPMVLDGSKSHTIRARRPKGHAKIGDTLYLYFGMRTRYCRMLREEVCTNVRTIIITSTDIYLIHRRLNDIELRSHIEHVVEYGTCSGLRLDERLRNALAWCDGFRPEVSTKEQPGDAFELMIRFWRSTHDLPFIGDLIDWKPTPEGLAKADRKPAKQLQ